MSKEKKGLDVFERRRFLKYSGLLGGSALVYFLTGCAADEGPEKKGEGEGEDVDFPTRSLTHIIPADPGGGWDLSSQVLADHWQDYLGQPLTMEHMPGAAAEIAFTELVTSPPDGYTTALCSITQVAPMLHLQDPDFDWDDIGFVGNLITEPDIILVHRDSDINNMEDFMKKAEEQELNVSVSLPLASTHLAGVIFREKTGANINLIPYGGGGPSRAALVNEEVDACIAPYWSALAIYESSKGIGLFSEDNPAPELHDAPSLNDVLGTDIPEILEPYAVYVRKDTQDEYPERYEKLEETFRKAFDSLKEMPEDEHDIQPFLDYRTPAECREFIDEFMSLFYEYEQAMEEDAD